MKARKPKANEPSLRELLSRKVLEVLVADADVNLTSVIEKLREKNPEKYVEAAVRAMAAAEPKANDYESCQSHEEMARKLLLSVGCDEFSITPEMIDEAVVLKNEFTEGLQAIRDRAQQGGEEFH